MERKIVIFKTDFLDFYRAQELKIQEKIEYVLDLVRFEQQIPTKFFKSIEGTNGIFEIRVITAFKSIRIFCFFDQGNLVVLMNCFIKKTQKTPRKEIKRAEKLLKEYISIKNQR